MNELIDEAIVGVCLDIHRSVKQGVYSVLEQSDEKMLVSSTFALTYFVVHRSLVILRQLVVEERYKGRIVSDFGLRCWSGRPCWVIVLCCWAKCCTLRVSLSNQDYEWVAANFQGSLIKCWGITLQWTSIPSKGGSSNTPSNFIQHGIWDKLWLGRPIGLSTDFTFTSRCNVIKIVTIGF